MEENIKINQDEAAIQKENVEPDTITDNKYFCKCSNKDYKTYIGYYYHCNTQKHKRFIGEIPQKVEEDPKERRKKYYRNLDPEKKKLLLEKVKEQSKIRRDKIKIESNNEPLTIINIVDKPREPDTTTIFDKLSPPIFRVYKATELTLRPKPGYKFAVCCCGSVINDYHRKTHEQTKKHKFVVETLGIINNRKLK